MIRTLLLSCILLVSLSSVAQNDAYDRQAEVIATLIEKGKFASATAQAKALIESGNQAQLPGVTARGRMLMGRILTENPAATAKERVRGIREMRRAAQGFKTVKDGEAIDEIMSLLEKLTGDTSLDLEELPSVRARRTTLPPDDSIETASLSAIVSLQRKEITALNDSQLRQVLILERQQRELDESAFARLNDSVLLIQQERVIDAQRAEVTFQRQQRNLLLVLGLAVLGILGVLYLRYRTGQKFQQQLQVQNEIITAERQRSEELLLNILPVTVAAELKDTGKATARSFASATVLFADFKGFSALAARLDPEELISLLDEAFREFDEIVARFKLEKIKTIGDAYMCAGGLPLEDVNHADRMVRAGLEMQAYLSKNPHFEARIGIHTGPVVAGVVGKHKFVYDIWGDTVNQASRLETAGEVGRVAISHTTKDLLGQEFICEAAGTFEAKNIGTMERFFVTLSA
ncbi:adenylate/guanylate cyclase domain-containing protein [Neolewinella aurantiaca]|uniref:Adenylate/guanylate cyclase domain-containing protein n=1 Tax=Neolewinella aurantiaca TaxID=2602767 RepID=A0A5C7FTC5_9BACT|nr:adenylate/guanylate cyclase domain-containing protein [Neolewinella aurantiaca]TXF89725.1 adenylate/guanylate cyclase domain-containing protein [Neolewinella aurantiaca]